MGLIAGEGEVLGREGERREKKVPGELSEAVGKNYHKGDWCIARDMWAFEG